MEEADEAFQELKQYLTSLPAMVAPEPSEHLLLYIMAKAEVVSMVLVIAAKTNATSSAEGISCSQIWVLGPKPYGRTTESRGFRVPDPRGHLEPRTPIGLPAPGGALRS
jgi:hypothetical protein